MTNNPDLRFVRRALFSVSDKTGVADFAASLHAHGVEIISTGGTARLLRDAGVPAHDISDFTGFPEMMDGRVKTLHPRVHGGLLALRDDEAHIRAAADHSIEMIDMVVVNLYPFEQTIARSDVSLAEAIEQIDIGGPAMIRSAAKNFAYVAAVVSPSDYSVILEELQRTDGALSYTTRGRLAAAAFQHTAVYDRRIADYLTPVLAQHDVATHTAGITHDKLAETADSASLPDHLDLRLRKIHDLRYGENPHQHAALYSADSSCNGIAHARVLHGKEMSYNNYLDADAAWNLVCDFDSPAAAIIKHTNPAGASVAETLAQAYRRALLTDPVSAFGGIVSFNRALNAETARAVTEIFTEVVVAPGYDDEALEILRSKKNLRVLQAVAAAAAHNSSINDTQLRQISGGLLVQTSDTHSMRRDQLRFVTKRQPTDAELSDMLFAWTVCKHTKSNAIVYARDLATVGVGAGQMSRVDSVRLGAERARANSVEVAASVLASDAFFPFRDGLDAAARHGITACIQPGGSVRDDEVIEAADEHNLAMVFTGTRHFRH